MNKCRKCGVELVAGENWYPSRIVRNDYICIKCHKMYTSQYHREHREEHNARQRRWRQNNPEKAKAHDCRYHEKYKEKRNEYSRWYHKEHREECLAYGDRYREEHREELREGTRRFLQEHPDYPRRYLEEHREKILARRLRWRQNNRERVREYGHRRRARLANAVTESVDEQAIFKRDGYTCIYCGSKENLTLDHIVPLATGGPHCEENLVIACKSCNSSKGTKSLEEWLRTQPSSRVWVM